MQITARMIGMVLALAPYGYRQAALPTPTSTSGSAHQAGVAPYIDRLNPALDALISPGVQPEKVANGFQFTEGPMWRGGRLWFSDLAGNRMYAVAPDGKVSLVIDNAGGLQNVADGSFKGSNAMVTDQDGSVLMCRHGARDVVRLDNELHQTAFLSRFEGKRFNSPNDLVFAPDGSLWITDPPFGLDKQDQDPAKETAFNAVYRYAHGRLAVAIRNLTKPNGIAFSPDGGTLYVSNSGPKMLVNRYRVKPDGALSSPTALIAYPDATTSEVPDGLKVDSAGNIWTTGPGGIRIVTPRGKVLGQIKLPEVAANLAWADGGYTLYITATTSIYRLRVVTPGEVPRYAK